MSQRDGRPCEKPSSGVGTCLWHVRGRAKRASLLVNTTMAPLMS